MVLGNDTRAVMQFRVAKSGNRPIPVRFSPTRRPVPRTPEASAVKTRILTVGEMDDKTGMAKMMLLNNAHWDMPITENPVLDSVEIWELLNFTDDSHPIHLHMVRFQILDRRSFSNPKLTITAVKFSTSAQSFLRRRTKWDGKTRYKPIPGDGDENHREVRGIRRTLRLALPHPRARRQ